METYLEQRYAIKFCCKAGTTAIVTYAMIRKAYGNLALSRLNFYGTLDLVRVGKA